MTLGVYLTRRQKRELVIDLNRVYRSIRNDENFKHMKPVVAAKYFRRAMVEIVEEYPQSRLGAAWHKLVGRVLNWMIG